MTHARSQHPNAPLTPEGRRRMVACVLDQGWTIEQTTERFQVDAKTVRKWRDRFLAEGIDGLQDRSSRPHRSPNRHVACVSTSCVVLTSEASLGRRPHCVRGRARGLDRAASCERPGARLDRGDRATDPTPVRRYQRERPGELIHVDVKKLAAIPDGGGWWMHGIGNDGHHGHSGAGYRYLHSALDDRTRIVYSEILNDEQAATAARSGRAAAWFATLGIRCERVITDNGSCYRSGLWHRACADTTNTTVKKTRRDDRKPTARSSATTASCSRNGPTSDPGPQKPTRSATSTSSTSTITTEPTAASAGQHPSAPSGTTSPRSTARPCPPTGRCRPARTRRNAACARRTPGGRARSAAARAVPTPRGEPSTRDRPRSSPGRPRR